MKDALVKIRTLVADDLPQAKIVSAKMHDFLRQYYRPAESAEQIGTGGTPFFRIVAVCKNKVIGIATYERLADSFYFGGLGVLPAYQKQGVARKLIHYIEIQAKKAGINKLTCATVKNTGSKIIFENLGFTITSEKATDKFISVAGNNPVIEICFEKEI